MPCWDDPHSLTVPLSLLCTLQKFDPSTLALDLSDVPFTVGVDSCLFCWLGTTSKPLSHVGEFPHYGPQLPWQMPEICFLSLLATRIQTWDLSSTNQTQPPES